MIDKVMRIEIMKELLNQMDNKHFLICNDVGNISILNEKLDCIGYIDFAFDEICLENE